MKRPYGYLVMNLQTLAKVQKFGNWETEVDLTSLDEGCMGIVCLYRLKKDAESAARRGRGKAPHQIIAVVTMLNEWPEVDELLAIVRELAGMDTMITYYGAKAHCAICKRLSTEDHAPNCIWLRAQKFRENTNDGRA